MNRLDVPVTDRELEAAVREVVKMLEGEGRWMSSYDGSPLPGQPKLRIGELFLTTDVFNSNMRTLSEYLKRDAIGR